MRIGLLGNTEMLIPTLGYLAQMAHLAGVGLWHKSAPLIHTQLSQGNVPDDLIQVIPDEGWQSVLSDWIHEKQMDVLLVFGFPHRIPQQVLSLPKHGVYNIHPGSLPTYRGADPLFWQICRGEQEIEICMHKMTKQFDAGPVVQQKRIASHTMDNYGLLMKRVAFETVTLVQGWLEGLLNNSLSERSQEEAIASFECTRRPGAADLRIKWAEQTAQEIKNLVAATNPVYGGASCYYGDMEIRILDVDRISLEDTSAYKAGEIVHSDALYGPIVTCADGQFLRLLVVQLAEGYFSGSKLFYLGIQKGHQLN